MIPPLDRFTAKVAHGPGCFQWMGGRGHGYGRFWLDGRHVAAHRFAYEQKHGPVPEGLELDHLCRNRACVNADHLRPLTHRENTLTGDTITAAKLKNTHCPSGHPFDLFNTYFDPKGHRRCRTCQPKHRLTHTLKAAAKGRPVTPQTE